MPSRVHRLGRRWGVAGSISALLLAMLVPQAVAAARPLTFHVNFASPCVDGQASNGVTVKLAWKDRDGALKARSSMVASEYGYWGECFAGMRLEVGDTLRGKVGATSRTLTIPKITMRIDRAADVIHGKAPSGAELFVGVYEMTFPFGGHSSTATTSDEGSYSADLSSEYDIIGGDMVVVRWRSDADDSVSSSAMTPYLSLTLGRPGVSGVARPNSLVRISAGDGSATARGDHEGVFSATLTGEDGAPSSVRRGDQVHAPAIGSDADWTVPAVRGRADASTNVVSGRCVPNGYFEVEAERANGSGWAFDWGTADGSGNLSVRMPDRVDFDSGWRVWLSCQLDTGDWIVKTIVKP